ncbi:MAG: hypothetical protein V3U27_20755 [Candidatus Tectomicrobia bacterium]
MSACIDISVALAFRLASAADKSLYGTLRVQLNRNPSSVRRRIIAR